mmetsp:Transcript_11117/g.29704  ORF Transcript_11117/g.29704 Transcript_11117/m.29704 type:complete len:290 (+) Transcript_11117:584-1453(+)
MKAGDVLRKLLDKVTRQQLQQLSNLATLHRLLDKLLHCPRAMGVEGEFPQVLCEQVKQAFELRTRADLEDFLRQVVAELVADKFHEVRLGPLADQLCHLRTSFRQAPLQQSRPVLVLRHRRDVIRPCLLQSGGPLILVARAALGALVLLGLGASLLLRGRRGGGLQRGGLLCGHEDASQRPQHRRPRAAQRRGASAGGQRGDDGADLPRGAVGLVPHSGPRLRQPLQRRRLERRRRRDSAREAQKGRSGPRGAVARRQQAAHRRETTVGGEVEGGLRPAAERRLPRGSG